MALRRVAACLLLGLAALRVRRGLAAPDAEGSPAEDEKGEYDDQDIEEEALSSEQLHALHGKFDQNGDGRISLQEVMGHADLVSKAIATKDIRAILDEIDTSKDGKLTLEEHLADIHNSADASDEEEVKELTARTTVEKAKFAAADLNGDQVLDEHEVAALFYPETHPAVLRVTVGETMRQKDANQDGRLTPREFWEADEAEGEEGDISEEEVADFAKLDSDGNGFLTANELASWESGRFQTEEAVKAMFEIADKDHDQHLTREELAEAKEQIAGSNAQYHLIEMAEHYEL